MKASGKLEYLNDILKYCKEYNSISENKNVPMIDTSNVSIYQEEFYVMFPVISKRSGRDDLKRTNEKCLDLNKVLKYFAIINGYKFNNEEINENITEFRYTNQNHLKSSSLNAYNRFYDSTPLSVIFCLAKSEYQAWLTMYCLYKSMKSLSSYLIYNAYYYDRNKTKNSWTKSIFTHNIQFLYTGVFLPEYRNKTKRIYKSLIKEEKSLYRNDTQKNVQEYFNKTNQYVYKYEISHDIYQKIYLEIMYFIMMNDYDFFSLCTEALTQRELNAQIHKILTGQKYIEDYLYPLKSLVFYFKVSKYKENFCKEFLKRPNSSRAFKLLCILDGKYDDEIISKTFKAMSKSKYFLLNKFIYELVKRIQIDYPDNYELNLFISRKLALEMSKYD